MFIFTKTSCLERLISRAQVSSAALIVLPLGVLQNEIKWTVG